MTDKQMAEKKSEFFKRFVDVFEYEDDWNEGVSFSITASINDVWVWISKLVEEVEKDKDYQWSEYCSALLGKPREIFTEDAKTN